MCAPKVVKANYGIHRRHSGIIMNFKEIFECFASFSFPHCSSLPPFLPESGVNFSAKSADYIQWYSNGTLLWSKCCELRTLKCSEINVVASGLKNMWYDCMDILSGYSCTNPENIVNVADVRKYSMYCVWVRAHERKSWTVNQELVIWNQRKIITIQM